MIQEHSVPQYHASATRTGWRLVAFGFVALALAYAARALLGLLMPIWEVELGWSRSLVSSGGALALFVMAATAPLAGDLIDRHGPRRLLAIGLVLVALGMGLTSIAREPWHFLVAFGGIAGLGFGIVGANALFAAVAPYFDRQRGLALGVVDAGTTVGPLVILPAAALLLGLIGWRFGMLAVAGVTLALLPVALRLLPRRRYPSASGADPESAAQEPVRAGLGLLLTSPLFYLLASGFVLCGFTSMGVIETHFLPYAAFCGFSTITAAGAFGFLSGINLVGILLAGWLSDRMHRPTLLAIIYGLRGATFILLMFVAGDPRLLYLFAGLFGLLDYASGPVVASLVASHLGIRVMGLAMGILGTAHALGAAAGALMGGIAFDYFGTYRELWLLSAGFTVLGALLTIFVREGPPAGGVPRVIEST